MAQLFLCKSFAEFAGEGRFENVGEALFLDVPEHDLSAVIQAAGDNPSVVENGHVRIQRPTSPQNKPSLVSRLSSLV